MEVKHVNLSAVGKHHGRPHLTTFDPVGLPLSLYASHILSPKERGTNTMSLYTLRIYTCHLLISQNLTRNEQTHILYKHVHSMRS